ncbi:hypothetical protein HPO96_37060 [Kribbella sandramycini]|uniref:Uncharacterized protein n=1 Tax=Kribbella sandramycini TaxID=60450 RepID=A0A7Y4L7I9_9ACTN|nr:hypothetical protein [Kribbella sandramycini]MBB6564408.1 hypothetical protein [Kribbella sandramycini]NOL45870.1 hypothetical protein [Kribbella sandramycini]
MTTPEALAAIDPDTLLVPNEVVCPVHHLTHNRHLPECPECKDARL